MGYIVLAKNYYYTMDILFIGNGFDLALKLPTSYRDFANSSFWPINPKDPSTHVIETLQNTLYKFAESGRESQSGEIRWIDLEGAIREYALYNKKIQPCSDQYLRKLIATNKNFLDVLKLKFAEYLRDKVTKHLDAYAEGVCENLKRIINTIYAHNCKTKIYSFNYTDTGAILSSFFNWENPDVTHLHGRVMQDKSNIILGVNDREAVDRSHRFLLKSHQEGFCSTNLFDDLNQATSVFFFGLSFGANDMDYFKDFFCSVIKKGVPANVHPDLRKKVNIFIFTLDSNSVADIKSFFEDAGVSIRDLYLNSNLHFIKTSLLGDGGVGDQQLSSFTKVCFPPLLFGLEFI